MSAALLAALLAVPLGAAEPGVSFEADPRVELLAVVHMLAEPESFARRFPAGPPPYALRARERFAPFSGHAAAERLRGLLKPGRRFGPARLLLDCSAPPELAEERAGDPDSPPRTKEEREFLEALRDFAARSGFMRFYGENAPYYAELVREARGEAARGLPPEAVPAYLRLHRPVRRRFLLSGLLSWELAANSGETRIRSALYGASMFDFEDPGTGPAHEIGHELLAPLARPHREELEAYAGLMPAGCTDTWLGCVMAHVDLAVALRVLASRRGEQAYASALARYRRFPFLPALGERLKDWEKEPGSSFEGFYPRLVAVFREALIKDAAERARATVAARAAPAPVEISTPAARTGISEPRLELAAALIGLADQREPAGPFASLAGHAAVHKTRRMLGKADQRALPAELMLYVSEPPALEPRGPVPAILERRAGGKEALEEHYAAVRDFAARADFASYYRGRATQYAELERRFAPRLAELSSVPGRVVVSSLLPRRYRSRLVRIASASTPEIWILMSDDRLGQKGPPVAGEPAEVVMKVDPRVELLSVLRLLGRPAEPSPGPASPYRREAERWFSSCSTHPAVALASGLSSAGAGFDLPAELVLRLSDPPDMYAREPVPEGYLEAAGGEDGADRFVEALNDFTRACGFTAFLDAHRDDHAAFASQAESEALSSMSPKAVQAYVGAPMSARYYFALAPLLSERSAANFSLPQHDRVEEVRLRPARWSQTHGYQFLLNHFGSSLAHELVHTVTNPLVANFDAKGAKAPAGCNDRTGTSWSGCIQEHLVYAVTLRILAQDLGEALYGEMVDLYKLRGFPYLGLLGERLKEYEADRARYRTLKEFYPRLEAVFAESLPKEAPAEPSFLDPAARRLKDEGVKEFMAGRFDAAAGKFKAALALSPLDAEALLNLGVASEKLGQAEEALVSYDRAVASSASGALRDRDLQVAALSSRASLLRALGRVDEARRDLELVLTIAPLDWEGREDVERRLAND